MVKNYGKKLIVILGPTASGKTALSIKLAKKFNGEIISADSRQVYKGMDIGTGKVTKKEMQGIPHYLLDVILPKRKFSVAQFQKLALKAIKKIQKKISPLRQSVKDKSGGGNKIPFLVGGTGFYIQSIIDGLLLPEIKPDWKLRNRLEKETTEKLYKMLKKKDKRRAKSIDKNNRRRLIRALEIIIKTKKPVPRLQKKLPQFDVLILGVKKSKEELKKLIRKRLLKRFKQGMIKETKKLHRDGISWKRLEEFGLEYRYIAYYLQKKITYPEMVENLQKEIEQFSKRQMTLFKKNGKINWIKNYKEAEKLVKKFLKNEKKEELTPL